MFYYGLFKEKHNKGGLLLKKKKMQIFTLPTPAHDPSNASVSLSANTKQGEIL